MNIIYIQKPESITVDENFNGIILLLGLEFLKELM